VGCDLIARRKEQVATRRIDDEAVLVPIRTSTAVPVTVHALGPVATFVWEALDGARDHTHVAALVAGEFDVELATATADVESFLSELSAAGLVEAA
jgi:hypothetical protein